MALELERWEMPGDSRREIHWGDGLFVHPDGIDQPAVYLRFYEWNVFGAAQSAIHSRADKSQAFVTNCHPNGSRGEVTYPAHGIDLFAEIDNGAVSITVRVENRSERKWPPVAGLIPCLNPGRDREDRPLTPSLADPNRSLTYYHGDDGLTPLEGRHRHIDASNRDLLEAHRPPSGVPDSPPWYDVSDDDAVDPLLIRESDDGSWVTGYAFEDALWVQGHNPWQCMHLCIKIGPLDPGENSEVEGRLYLERSSPSDLLDRYRTEFQ